MNSRQKKTLSPVFEEPMRANVQWDDVESLRGRNMIYKGYIGQAQWDDDAQLFHGDVLHLRDLITFQGDTPVETEAAFRDSADDYLEWCAELRHAPGTPLGEPLQLEQAGARLEE